MLSGEQVIVTFTALIVTLVLSENVSAIGNDDLDAYDNDGNKVIEELFKDLQNESDRGDSLVRNSRGSKHLQNSKIYFPGEKFDGRNDEFAYEPGTEDIVTLDRGNTKFTHERHPKYFRGPKYHAGPLNNAHFAKNPHFQNGGSYELAKEAKNGGPDMVLDSHQVHDNNFHGHQETSKANGTRLHPTTNGNGVSNRWSWGNLGETLSKLHLSNHGNCLPPCENGGSCTYFNKCECTNDFEGPQCQYRKSHCADHPPTPLNAEISCTTSVCSVKCSTGYAFPDGSSSTSLLCLQGIWVIERLDWTSLPDCKPNCDPPCQNGGKCFNLKTCRCPMAFTGPQCQYEVSSCDSQKLNFNGIYSCRGENEVVLCTLKCPDGHNSNIPIADEYICHYSSGTFLPKPIPKCIYSNDAEVFSVRNSSLAINGGSVSVSSGGTNSHRLDECVIWNGRHYKTMDGTLFSFEGNCSYTLVQDVLFAKPLKITTGKTTCLTSKCTRTLNIFYNSRNYLLHYKDGESVFAVDGAVKKIPLQLDDFVVVKMQDYVSVSLEKVDIHIKWTNKDRLSLSMSSESWRQMEGLCRNGKEQSSGTSPHLGSNYLRSELETFIDVWRSRSLTDSDDCDAAKTSSSCESRDSEPFCLKLFNEPEFSICREVEGFQSYVNSCIWDECTCGKSCACETLKELVEECKRMIVQRGIPDFTSIWREIANCPVVCPTGQVYSMCGPSMQPTCGSLHQMSKYSECVEGCHCPDGQVFQNDRCIPPENCGCQWGNQWYALGNTIRRDCNTCTCQEIQGKPEWKCEDQVCSGRCAFVGASHFETFDGKRYNFEGKCSYYLVRTDNYHIKSDTRHHARDIASGGVSFDPSSRSLSIIISTGNDVIKLQSHKQILLNGKDVSFFPISTENAVIRSVSSLYIVVTLSNGVEVWWDENSKVYIDLPGNETYDATGGAGLCGTFNGNQKDDFLTPEGDVEEVPLRFAEKWKVNELCEESDDPFQSDPCELYSQNKMAAEKYCKLLKEDVFGDCHGIVDVEPFFKSCLYEVCSCQKNLKSCLCPILSDYGERCSRNNVTLPWRTQVRECGFHCPLGQIYQPCGNSCARSCQDIALMNGACSVKCAEGCNCPEGLTLNSVGECVPVSSCYCNHNNVEFKAGHELIRSDQNEVEFCTCENAKWNCRPATSLEIARDYENGNAKCNETLHEEYTTCEPAEPKTCRNMHEKAQQSNRICFPGCTCSKGFVWDSIGKICVNATECPCHHGGRSYQDGDQIQKDCNTCTCEDGLWRCTEEKCSSICSTWGDSHFKTFDGRVYDFEGSCEFLMARGILSDDETFFVTLAMVPCGSTGVSCPKSVTLTVGSKASEEKIVFKKSKPVPQQKSQRIFVREAGLFVFAEVFDLGITVQWDKNTRVYLKADSRWKKKVEGLCGNFNDKESDDFKTPTSGEISEISASLFADSWRMYNNCPESNPLTNACDLRPWRKAWAVEKCSVMKSEVFEACHSEVSFKPYLEGCITDTCGCDEGGDCECLCSAISGYAEECTLKGIPIKWRSQLLCPMQCDAGLVYHSCVSTCPTKSCENHLQHESLYETCKKESCVEGCEKPQCPHDHVYANDTSTDCVPISLCQNFCLKENGFTYLEGDLMELDECHKCYCSHHQKRCIGKPCSTTTTLIISPEVPTTPSSFISNADCAEGFVWDDCISTHDRTCHYPRTILQSFNICISGCKPIGLECSPDFYLRNDFICVDKKDCPCTGPDGLIVKPGDVVEVTECEKCQCLNNEFECVSSCTAPPGDTARNHTNIIYLPTPGIDFGEDGNVTLIYHHATTTAPSFHASCPADRYESLISNLTKFSASSQLNDLSGPEQARMNGTSGWMAAVDDAEQYVQIDLGKVEPVFGVNVGGVSGKYVKEYHLQYSANGEKFVDVLTADGQKEVFTGSSDSSYSSVLSFRVPLETRYIRFRPISWHEGIGLRVDVFGCADGSSDDSDVPPVTSFPQVWKECDKPIGMERLYRSFKLLATVSSSKPEAGPEFLGLEDNIAWQPLTNSKSEWIQIDFGGTGNFTGIVSKGIANATDGKESWVEKYTVSYTRDGTNWISILDDFGKEMIFMGNVNGRGTQRTYFKRPIRAKSLRINFVKWHENIAFNMDVLGCYNSSTEMTVVPPTEKPGGTCNVCRGAINDGEDCKCTESEWWDGDQCVSHSECPCFVGTLKYPVGTTYATGNCDECVCRLHGVPQCSQKTCPDCSDGLQKLVTPLCGCTCKPCEENSILCPSSNTCLEKSAWCDGIEDCPDDEQNCSPPQTTTPKSVEDKCEVTCPPGYNVKYKSVTAGPSESEFLGSTWKKLVTTYKSYRKWRKHDSKQASKQEAQLQECPSYDCEPADEDATNECPRPECPLDYIVVLQHTDVSDACPLYTCNPVLQYDNCTASSQGVKTFDGIPYDYEICDHVLVRHDRELWNISMFKDCNLGLPCPSNLLIRHGNDTIQLLSHNLTIKMNSFVYRDEQIPPLNSKIKDFNLNIIGNSIIFTSYIHGFEVVFDSNGNAQMRVANKLKGHLSGLCGLYNGVPGDDRTTSDGKLSRTVVEFGNSWTNPGGRECEDVVCSVDKQNIARATCMRLRQEPFDACFESRSLQPCIESICACLSANKTEDECKCSKLAEVASKCANPKLFGWRVEQNCPSSCPPNFDYYDCYPYACQPTCGTVDECAEPSSECFSGCFCPDGMVKNGDECMTVTDCRDCLCSGMGDSTYVTFDGALTFNGNCTYVATRAVNPSGKPNFVVLITNDLCNDSDFVTCTKMVEIKMAEHSIKFISQPETEGVKILVDEVERDVNNLKKLVPWAKLDFNAETSSVMAKLPKQHLSVRYFFKKSSFTISLPSHVYGGKVEGLCGTCSGNTNLESMEGPEAWQINPDEKCLIEPSVPCSPTPEHEKMCQLMTDTTRFGQCLAFVDPNPFIDQCLETVCLNGHLCNSLEAFAQACRDAGICVPWRSNDFCPFTCPSDLEYQHCRSGCLESCENLEDSSEPCQNSPVEGCFCPNDEILINGTCKPTKYCTLCDDQSHREGDIWEVDKCTNCTCNNQVITCNRVRCQQVEIICREDEVLVTGEDENGCCPETKCVCKPREECEDIDMPNQILPPGMEVIIMEDDCCPKREVICRKNLCPEPQPCRPHYIQTMTNTTGCCPEYNCEKPVNLCIYEFEGRVITHGSDRKRREVLNETIKEVGERWYDGPCKSCVCVQKNGRAEAICTMTECPTLEAHQDYNEYELVHVTNSEKCCPEVVRRSCKHKGRVYAVGDSWLPNEDRPCETMKCNDLGDGFILKEIRLQICNMDCDQGWNYTKKEGECCGHCIPVGCVVDDHIYEEGDTWESEDGCAQSTCIRKKNGQVRQSLAKFSTSTVFISCPSIEDCPEDDVYSDGCCLKCKIKVEDRKICSPQPMPLESTAGLIEIIDEVHGLCHNKEPLQNYAYCAGNCKSFTEFNPVDFGQRSVCKCCRVDTWNSEDVLLDCADGSVKNQTIKTAATCSCQSCGS